MVRLKFILIIVLFLASAAYVIADEGNVIITSSPVNASIAYIDVNDTLQVFTTPSNLTLPKGNQTIAILFYYPFGNGSVYSHTIEIIANETVYLNQSIDYVPTGNVFITTDDFAYFVLFDGAIFDSPLNLSYLMVGDYNYSIESPWHDTINSTFSIFENQTTIMNISLPNIMVNVSINTVPNNVTVYWGNISLGTTPLITKLPKGYRELTLIKPFYVNQTFLASLTDVNTSYEYNLTLDVQSGSVLISSNPDNASIYIDGAYLGQSPLSANLTFSNHSITVQKTGYYTYSDYWFVDGNSKQFSLSQINVQNNVGYSTTVNSHSHSDHVKIIQPTNYVQTVATTTHSNPANNAPVTVQQQTAPVVAQVFAQPDEPNNDMTIITAIFVFTIVGIAVLFFVVFI